MIDSLLRLLPRRFNRPLLFLLALVALASCIPGAKAPPQIAPSRTLSPEGEAEGTSANAPFGVVFASPKGGATEASEVMIVFNRPMRALEMAGDESSSPARIVVKGTQTSPRGSWRWMGTRALIFAPEGHLPRATEYAVNVPAGTKALDGSALAQTYAFDFETPHLEVVRSNPDSGDTRLEPGQTFEVVFNQAMDLKEVERGAQLFVGEGGAAPKTGKGATGKEARGKRVAIGASWPKPDHKEIVKLTPRGPLPLASKVALVLDPSLRGTEGPLPLRETKELSMRTYGALVAERVSCSHDEKDARCASSTWMSIELSNAVTFKDFKAHVRIEPAVSIRWSSGTDDEEKSSDFGFAPATLPARSYRVVVSAGLKDEHGQVLARDAVFPVATADLPPSAQLGLSGEIFEPAGKRRDVPVTAVNLDAYEWLGGALDEAALLDFVTGSGRGGDDGTFERAARALGKRPEVVRPGAAKNVEHVRAVPLDGMFSGGRGVGVVGLRYLGPRGQARSEAHVVNVTDLAISAKMSRFGSLVWVTRLSDGRPVPSATVSVLTRGHGVVVSVTTDANGLATLPAAKYSPIADGTLDRDSVLVVRSGGDWTYRTMLDTRGLRRGDVPLDESGRLSVLGILFTDRGVYRPGETVRVKGLLRREAMRGTESLTGREVLLTASDGYGEEFFKKTTKVDAFGGFAVDVPVPATAHLGGAGLQAKLANTSKDGEEAGIYESVQLAAYKAAEFKVTVDPEKPAYVRGDKGTFTVRGDYLFGAPMSGEAVRFNATRSRTDFTPPGAEGIVVDDWPYEFDFSDQGMRGGNVQNGDGKLDAKGTFSTQLGLALPQQTGAEVVTFEAEVEDVSRQSVAGRSSVVVHPGEFYVGLKPPKDFFVPKGTPVRAELAAVEPSGKRRAGVPVHVELVRRTWRTVVEATGDDEGHYHSKPVDRTVGACDVTTGAQLVGCDLPLNEAGYFLLRATAKDRRGNPLAASASLYGTGDGVDLGWLTDDSTKLDLVADKKSYEVGDTAQILVKSPFRDAEALVTVERAGILRSERTVLHGAAPTVRVPITDDMRPNAYVSIEIVRGRTKAAPEKGVDVGAPAFRLGYAELRINPEARRLKVAITPNKKDYRPGEMVDADLAVTDRAGKGAKGEVTFYVVDEGVLMLTGYKTPDPLPAFTSPRALAVFPVESRADLGKIFRAHVRGAGTDKGDEGGGGGGPLRADFRATAYFEPSVMTGADGKAHVRFKLPDNLTTYRLMAVVASDDERFGFGESRITASRPLMVRPALPRFLRAGDAMEAGVVISSKGMAATQVDITIAAQGVTVMGDARRTLALPAGGSVEVRWPVTAPQVGPAKFTFRAGAGGESDAVEVTRTVQAPLSLEAVALYGETREASAERLGDLGAIRNDIGTLDVRLASTALVGLADGAEQLLEYPYGCTEQLTSRLVPMLPLRTLAKDFNIPLPKDVDRIADETLVKILANQHPNGLFAYWPDSPDGNEWLTAYALWGLEMAQANGHRVPADAMDRAAAALRRYLDHIRWEPWEMSEAAFVLDVLASAGKPDPGYTSRVYDQRSKLPLSAQALLAHAMVLAKMDHTQVMALTQELENHLRLTTAGAVVTEKVGDNALSLDSDGRTTALVLRALVAANPKHAMAARVARGLLAMRQHGRWQSTQEAAWALIALDDYRRAQEKTSPDFDATVFFGNTELFSAPFREKEAVEKTKSIPVPKLFEGGGGSTLAFQIQGKGELFYEARLRYARKELPRDELDRGFYVWKVMRSVEPGKLAEAQVTLPKESATSVRAGDLVLVDLFVVTPDPREQVVLDDPLPAGLEGVDTTLATTAQSLNVEEGEDETDADDDERRGEPRSMWFHREVHDDRVLTFVEHMPAGMFHYRYLARATTHGKFVVPPTRAECMYDPAIFGRTAASVFQVVQK